MREANRGASQLSSPSSNRCTSGASRLVQAGDESAPEHAGTPEGKAKSGRRRSLERATPLGEREPAVRVGRAGGGRRQCETEESGPPFGHTASQHAQPDRAAHMTHTRRLRRPNPPGRLTESPHGVAWRGKKPGRSPVRGSCRPVLPLYGVGRTLGGYRKLRLVSSAAFPPTNLRAAISPGLLHIPLFGSSELI